MLSRLTFLFPVRSVYRIWALLVAICAATLGIVWFFELFFSLPPCDLCLKQRWSYYIALFVLCPIMMFGLRTNHHFGCRISSYAALITISFFALGGAIGAYHAGIEWGFWPGPATCTSASASSDFSAFRDSFYSPVDVPPPCHVVALRIFGISLAGYNILVALICILITIRLRREIHRFHSG